MQKVLIIIAGLALFGCNGNEPTPNTVEVEINFDHLVDGEPVVYDQIIYQNALGQDFSIKTIKYFVTRLQFHEADGTSIIVSDEFYVDAREPERLVQSIGSKIPQGDYTGISLVHGLTVEDNQTGKYTQPPESLMEWPIPMGGGYHYMKLEGEYKIDETTSFFNFHSGMLEGFGYEIHIDLDKPFTINSNAVQLKLQMEIQNWFSNPNEWDFAFFGPGIMGNKDAQAIVQENGHNVYTFEVVNNTNE